MKKDRNDKLAEIFKALSHPTRLQIVAGLIANNECNVSQMTEELKIPQPTVSQHISILKSSGIIEGYRIGNQVCYKVISEDVKRLFEIL